ncbi:hypothetical protein CPC08DRAFT_625116 [Agrocybe pediades]|nr:hypothetical protein CPC08DRAFT_625116 [Agrocybe pediades]
MPAARDAPHNDITEAVRDTVTVRPVQESSRGKITRTQTGVNPTVSSSRPTGKRSQSEDQGAILEKPRTSGKSKATTKKGSQHADVIDRLDFTGVGPMFHHDGPFDACAPSRNKHRNKAPMYAWGTAEESAAPRYGDSAYPAPSAYAAFSNDYPEQPKKKVDAIAEAWGIHEPEPFEEFFAGGGSGRHDGDTPTSSIYNGKESNARTAQSTRRPRDPRDDNRPRMVARRSVVPPPQPIFVGDPAEVEVPQGSPPPSSPGIPKRSKSLMHRIRKMRDAPNVPVGPDYSQAPPSPSSPTEPMNSSRPTHRPQNSFLGRFAGNKSPNPTSEPPEPFVFIEAHTNKDLPAPPPVQEASSAGGETYFDAQQSATGATPGGGAGGLGRKTSLMKKVGRVVRGTK